MTNEEPRHDLPKPSGATTTLLPTVAQLGQSPEDYIDNLDIAAMNGICAFGLPGAESLSIADVLAWIAEAARVVEYETQRNYPAFTDNPAEFGYSQARFCVLHLVTVLQRKLGVRYNPKWEHIVPEGPIPEDFGADANDVFIHAIIDGIGGTCSSLPVLYVAVGRRLGYPLKLVKAHGHIFFRWDDPTGKLFKRPERFNIEATGPGIHFLSDDFYKTWPREIQEEDIEAGIFLKSLSPAEELAESIACRAKCFRENGLFAEAAAVYAWAVRLAPHNRYFAGAHARLCAAAAMQAHLTFLSAGVAAPAEASPTGAHWITGTDGHEMLVQVLKPGHHAPPPPLGGGHWHLMPEMVQLPNGRFAHAHVPLSGPGLQLQAEWLRLPEGEYALVHRRAPNAWQQPLHFGQPHVSQASGRPVLPENGHPAGHWAGFGHHATSPTAEMLPHERAAVINAIEQLSAPRRLRHVGRPLPSVPFLALPPGPARPRLPAGAYRP